MARRRLFCVVVAGALLIQAQQAISCSLAPGYFHQVTRLRGSVVGMSNYWPLLGYAPYPRWLRQRITRPDATLRIYEYRLPLDRSNSSPIRTVKTDRNGWFDFGTLPTGHYTLLIDWSSGPGLFDVEITDSVRRTASVKIDVSPVNPACEGGHEFMISSE